ncbi:hypothetical protein ACHHYP_04560 [Achlya hypogyna]|uniref:Uncharacterized protein n=1 Tax=Achlya hypogyna TaxID=1202772 RepID=A0A1V9Z0R1_ACHHY|nr:hypothetical protein ACHHYP_04560 [Achlya hypogyna]
MATPPQARTSGGVARVKSVAFLQSAMASEDDVTPELLQRLQRSCSIRRSNSTPECTCDVVCDGSCIGRQQEAREDNDVGDSSDEEDGDTASGDEEDDDATAGDEQKKSLNAATTNAEDAGDQGIDVDDLPKEFECKRPVAAPLPSLQAAPTVPSPAEIPKQRSRSHPPALIEYLWHGEPLGLEICRSRSKYGSSPFNQPRYVLRWKHGPIGITFGIEKATRQVYIKRVNRDVGNVHPGFLLVFANGVVVSERNFDAVMTDLKRNHDAGREQTLEFIPPPPPPMARLLTGDGPLARVGVNAYYELMLVGDTRALYLSLPEIQHALQTAPRPTRLTFCFNPAAHDVLAAQMAPRKADKAGVQFDNKVVAAAALAAVICL